MSAQPSLLDARIFEAAAVFHTASQFEKEAASNCFFGQKDIHSLETEQVKCLLNRMRQLLEVLPGGVIVLDGNGVVQQCNSTAIDLLGEPLEGEKWLQVIQRVFDPFIDDGHDISLVDGRLVHISTSPLEGEPGQIILLQDVTDTRKLQQKVSHLQRLSALGEMAARLAHQIRTPLSSALLYLSPLLKEEGDPKLKYRFAKRLHNSITHMEHLVKDMLAFSRGDMSDAEPLALHALLLSVEQQFLAQPDIEHIRFILDNRVPDGYLYGSHDALCSAINNLLNNAKQACDGKGEIILSADHISDDAEDSVIEISVKDNGSGITEEDQEKILTPFFTTRSSGTGLGLAVVKSIVNAHKGELFFESIQGEGSTFTLRLPRYRPAEEFSLTGQKRRITTV